MRKFRFSICLIFLFIILQHTYIHLMAGNNRIEGKVLNKETSQPIYGANIYLFRCQGNKNKSIFKFFKALYIKTNKLGFFKFDNLKEGFYSLSVFKDGFSTEGSFFLNSYETINSIYEKNWEIPNLKEKGINLVNLQTKSVKIELEKEAILKVRILKKIPSGIESYTQKTSKLIKMTMKHNSFVNKASVDFANEYETKFFKEGLVDLEISPHGYKTIHYKNVELEKGKTTKIEYVVDYTKGQVFHGILKYKDSNGPIYFARVFFQSSGFNQTRFEARLYTDRNGEFWIGGFPPGTYSLVISKENFNDPYKRFKIRKYIKISLDEKKEFFMDF